jgi:predicted TIM-barrel fold metal-dependent hydrolase
MDLNSLIAIDVHTHAWKSALQVDDAPTDSQQAMGRYFRYQPQHQTVPEMARMYRKLKMAFVLFSVDGEKFHPSVQEFFPNERMAYPLYEAIAEAKLPALFHTGQTGVGAATRGGGGIRLKYSHPMLLDDVAVDFPEMPIILAHPSFPWQEEVLSVATHKPQVYIDLSGWSPKYFPPILVQYANTLLKDKVLFGSDYPVLSPERWMEEFDKLPIKPEVRPLILKVNAARLLNL